MTMTLQRNRLDTKALCKQDRIQILAGLIIFVPRNSVAHAPRLLVHTFTLISGFVIRTLKIRCLRTAITYILPSSNPSRKY